MADRIVLTGRSEEQARLAAALGEAHTGGSVLLVQGAPGLGKSALLEWAASTAAGFRVLRAQGIAAEFELPFGALHQLVRPLVASGIAVSDGGRWALAAALGEVTDRSPSVFEVGMALLDLLSAASAESSLLVLVDDVQWIDPSSQAALAFVVRRLGADAIVLFASARPGRSMPLTESWIPRLDLRPLTDTEAERLLARASEGLDSGIRAAVLELAGGNPLALIELPRTLTSSDIDTTPGGLPLSYRLERSFAERADTLDAATRLAVELAAIDDSDDLTEVLLAVRSAGYTEVLPDLDEAASAGLLTVQGSTIRFAHPLVRSSLVQSLSPADRRARHRLLAAVLPEDSERGLRHRAAAALLPDERLADELERSAERAVRRGAASAAADALERAAQLSVDRSARRRRTEQGTALAYEAGRRGQGDRLRSAYRDLIESEHDRLRWEWLCELAGTDRGGDQGIETLVMLAGRAHALEEDVLAIRFLRSAAVRCWNFRPADPIGRSVIRAAEALPELDPIDRAAVLAYGAPLERADDVLDLIRSIDPIPLQASDRYRLGHAAACIGAFGLSESLFAAAADGLRAEGRLHTLGTTLVLLAWSALRRGHWPAAAVAAAEGTRLCAETLQPFWEACGAAAQAVVAANQGRTETARMHVSEAETIAAPSHFSSADAVILVARAAIASAEGEHDRAFAFLARIHDPSEPAYQPVHGLWSLSSLADAALLAGEVDRARQILHAVQRTVGSTGSPAGRMHLAYATAVLAVDDELETRLRRSLEADVSSWPVEHDRLMLTLGTVLRRRRNLRESRELLRRARDGFDRLGAEPAARRAREELRAAGERSSLPTDDLWSTLSPQEAQVAALAAQGLTNREIGERLYLSHRTIAAHLYRAFPKLGITSRNELVRLASGRGHHPLEREGRGSQVP